MDTSRIEEYFTNIHETDSELSDLEQQYVDHV